MTVPLVVELGDHAIVENMIRDDEVRTERERELIELLRYVTRDRNHYRALYHSKLAPEPAPDVCPAHLADGGAA
ncbi:MAG: hypothetical protein GY856_36885 [bacterium]|nr:hypothetical protein [bacterium]